MLVRNRFCCCYDVLVQKEKKNLRSIFVLILYFKFFFINILSMIERVSGNRSFTPRHGSRFGAFFFMLCAR